MPPLESATVALTEIAESARQGLLALAVGTGLQVMQAWMTADVEALCGPRGRHNPERAGYRHGTEAGSVTVGGRRVPIPRPWVRAADGSGALAVPGYELFSSTELLSSMAMERMLAGLSTRRYRSGLEPVGTTVEATSSGTSKSAVSRKFVAATETALAELMSADLSGLDLVALMVDGVHFAEHCCVVALGIGLDGTKHPLALEEGSTENATLVTDLLVGLRERGLDVRKPILVVRAIHLTGGVLVGSPWPVRWRALQTGRFPAAARRRWWRLAGLLVDDQISVPDRAVIDRELEDPVEDHASAARSAAVEPEHELVHVRR